MGKKVNRRKQQQKNNVRGYATTNQTAPSAAAGSNNTKAAGTSSQHASKSNGGIAVSSEIHQKMLTLLGIWDDEDHATAPTSSIMSVSPDRFTKKIFYIHDTLDQLGFSFDKIQKAVVALGYAITLESALDWLCLHLTTKELPPILTEATVREGERATCDGAKSTSKSSSSLTVIKPIVPPTSPEQPQSSSEKRSQAEKITIQPPAIPVVPSPTVPTTTKEKRNTEPEDSSTKAWILQQYQYEDDEEKEGEHETSKPMAHELQQKGGRDELISSLETTAATATATASAPDKDPYEVRLLELEKQLHQHEADLKDEASNYLRSKREIKQLQSSTNKLRQQVQKLRAKVHAAKAAASLATGGEDENEGDGGFFGMFGEGEDGDDNEDGGGKFFSTGLPSTDNSQSQPAKESKPERLAVKTPTKPPEDPVVPKDSIPAGWTGQTPKAHLEDWCRKQKLRRPQFFKLAQNNGARLRLETSTDNPVTLETDNYMGSYVDAQHCVALRALYRLNPDLPLYRLFPPYYRDLWNSWTSAKEEAHTAQRQQEQGALESKIQMLIDSVPKPVVADAGTTTAAATNIKVPHEAVGSVTKPSDRDYWDDDLHDEYLGGEVDGEADEPENDTWEDANEHSLRIPSEPQSSQTGQEMRLDFITRQHSHPYQSMLKIRSTLPMYAFRQQALSMIKECSVTIVCAETGAGKTTQLPSFILEEALLAGKGDKVSILCTQPRRVAATSVAERVSEELAERALGDIVGYQIRLEAKRSTKTRLLFCTTGIVLRRLQEDPTLEGVTHVVVDEVHERQYEIDVLLVILRQLLRNSRPDLKVILMSATIDAKLFSSFYNGAPVLNVPGRTFPVAQYHLEDLLESTNHIIEEGSRYAKYGNGSEKTTSLLITTRGGEKRSETVSLDGGAQLAEVSDDYPGYSMATRRSMDRVNEAVINYDLIEDVLLLLLVEPDRNDILLPPDGASFVDGSVLVFLPGFGEIRTLTDRLVGNRSLGSKARFDIIPMHSTLSPQDQKRAFLSPKKGTRKIILATNICETSVTIPDVVCVIDSGRVREVRVDKRTSTSRLVTDWCSRASAKQRAGRAGRVQPGICLKLFSSRTAAVTMKEATEPEIKRVPLEDICLRILAGSFSENCFKFLSQTPQPPAEQSVVSALRILQEVGAITMSINASSGIISEQLSPLGFHLAKLPVDVRLGKMLIFGALFNCIDPIVTIAASLSCQSPFPTFVNNAFEAKSKHKQFAHPQSDFMTLCNVWNAYAEALKKGQIQARRFCYENFLKQSALIEVADTRRHFLDLLFGSGFLQQAQLTSELKGKQKWTALHLSPYNANGVNIDVVHAVVCAGLYPHVAHLVPAASGVGERPMWHKTEQLHFHSSSVNSNLKTTGRYPTSWIAFHEKFGTQHRVSVSTTCFVHPFALLIFGGSLIVKHTERKVVLDDWIELPMAAQSAVMFRELRKHVDRLLQRFLYVKKDENGGKSGERATAMVTGIVKLLSMDPQTVS